MTVGHLVRPTLLHAQRVLMDLTAAVAYRRLCASNIMWALRMASDADEADVGDW